MALGTIARVATEFGKPFVARRKQQEQAQQQIDYQQMKENAFMRRMMEKKKEEEKQRKILLEREKVRQQEMTKRSMMDNKFEREKWKEQKSLKEREITSLEKLRKSQAAKGNDQFKLLDLYSKIGQRYSPYHDPVFGAIGGDPEMQKKFSQAITDLARQLGIFPQEQPQPGQTIGGNNPMELMQSYYQQLIRGGIDKEQAKLMTQQRFGQQQQLTGQNNQQQNNDPLGIR